MNTKIETTQPQKIPQSAIADETYEPDLIQAGTKLKLRDVHRIDRVEDEDYDNVIVINFFTEQSPVRVQGVVDH